LINYDGRAEASIVVPLDTVELNVTAFYNGTSTVFGVVSSTNSVALTSETIGSPPLMVFSSLMLLVAVQQSQNFPLYILIGASVAAVAVAASRARRMILTPQRALASLENIIVDHIATGATLWFYDFLTLGQDVALVSGFMSAVKSFMGEMQKGGLKRLGTEFGTLIREEGQQIAVTLIVGRVGAAEENWLRRKMVRFISLVEGELASELTDWRGDIAVFKEKLPLLLGVVTDLERVKKLQGMRVEALKRERAQLKKQLNDIGSRLEQWREQFESGKLTLEEYQKIQKEWEPEYSRVQEQYIHTQLVLQRFPPDLSDREKAKKLGQIKNDFFRIQGEIDELSRKYEAGRMSKRDLKKRDELSRRLNSLLKELEKYDTNMSG
jgi:predicted  nucleic acid-binding Zn-ribbon protein